MRNPYRAFREGNVGLSPEAFAELLNVSPQLLRFAEAGLYSLPPSKLVVALQEADFIDPPSAKFFAERYLEFQEFTRRQNFGRLDPRVDLALSLGLPTPIHPMQYWRENSSPKLTSHGCCRSFCFPVNTFSEFENDRYNTIPISIKNALFTSGYTPLKVNELEVVYAAYRERLTEGVTVDYAVR